MNVINPAARAPWETAGPFDVMAEHTKHFFAKFRVLKECLAFLRAEDRAYPDLRQRLWHGGSPLMTLDFELSARWAFPTS